jgi:hypothetical protein
MGEAHNLFVQSGLDSCSPVLVPQIDWFQVVFLDHFFI